MTHPFEVTEDHVRSLTDKQLPRLLRRLYSLQLSKLGVQAEPEINLEINAADGGEDGYLAWENGPDPDGIRVRNRITCIQAKATKTPASKCKVEVRQNKGRGQLKRRLKRVLELGGEYVLYCSAQPLGDEQRDTREKALLAAIRDAPDAPTNIQDSQVRFVEATKIAEWCNEFSAAQVAVFAMQDRLHHSGVFQTLEAWRRGVDSLLPYVPDTRREEAMRALAAVARDLRAVARVLGLPGLGKTRLVLEALSQMTPSLEDSCVYVANGDVHGEYVLRVIQGWVLSGTSGTLVVDECPPDLHDKLEGYATRPDSKLSLITLDHDPVSRPETETVIVLEPLEDACMRKILVEAPAPPPDSLVSAIVVFAAGFPRMLELVLAAGGQRELWRLAGSERVRRMLEGRGGASEAAKRVLTILSLFDPIGVGRDAREQLEWVCENVCPGEQLEEIDKIIKRFKRRRIVDQRGDYVRVTPPPFAAALAASWWGDCDVKEAVVLLVSDKPRRLQRAVFARMRLLSGHAEVVDLAARVLSANGPFSSSATLLSAEGCRVLSCLADINRSAVLLAVQRALEGADTEGLRCLTPRRELLQCLDKLCWHGDTFQEAAWILFRLGAAQLQPWGNSPEDLLRRLYQLLLSGTTVPAAQRLGALDRATATGKTEFVRVAVVALDGALKGRHFTRSHSGELPDGRLPHRDWQPAARSDIDHYREAAAQRLTSLASRNDEIGSQAREVFARHVRDLVREGRVDLVEAFVTSMLTDSAPILGALREVLAFDSGAGDETAHRKVEALVHQLEPKTLESRLRYLTSDFAGSEFVRSGDSWESVSSERARALGRELAEEAVVLKDSWDRLLTGDQPLGSALGAGIGEGSDDAVGVLADAYGRFLALPALERSDAVLRGILREGCKVDRGAVGELLDRCAADGLSFGELLSLTLAAWRRLDEDLERLAAVARANPEQIGVAGRSLGLALDGASDTGVAAFIDQFLGLGDAAGSALVEALGFYLHRRDAPPGLQAAMRNLLAGSDVFASCAGGSSHADDTYRELLRKWLNSFTATDEFVRGVVGAVLRAVVGDTFLAFESASDVIVEMLRAGPSAAWEVLSDALASGDEEGPNWALSGLLRGGHYEQAPRVPIDEVPEELIESWVARDGSRALILAHACRALDWNTESAWSRIARWLLEHHGAQRDVLDALRENAEPKGSFGSRVPGLERERDAFQELVEHRNPDVARWAARAIREISQSVEDAQHEEAAQEFGVFH